MKQRNRRRKISTTISKESHSFLRRLMKTGRAGNLAEAVDHAVLTARRVENRNRLERATADYFEHLPPDTAREEAALETALGATADEADIDA